MPVVVLISGRGSNLKAIIDAVKKKKLSVDIKAVISNNCHADGLVFAEDADINVKCFDKADFSDRESFDHALQMHIDTYSPGLVILAGYMQILSDPFVQHYHGRLLNIHPSLLPDYPGLHTHQRAIDDQVKKHGASVHFVTRELDGGPVVSQTSVPVLPDDTPESLARRVLAKEHPLYITAIDWFVSGRLTLQNDKIHFDGKPLHAPKQLEHH